MHVDKGLINYQSSLSHLENTSTPNYQPCKCFKRSNFPIKNDALPKINCTN